jgi:HEPN domain-containing protein
MGKRIDAEKHVAHWREGSIRSFACVPTLAEGQFWAEALFWTHLVVEKVLKAHVAKVTQDFPPQVHNLLRLAELGDITLTADQVNLCQELNKWQLKARYMGDPKAEVDAGTAQHLIDEAKKFQEWLLIKL